MSLQSTVFPFKYFGTVFLVLFFGIDGEIDIATS